MKYATRLSTDALRHLKQSRQLRAQLKRRGLLQQAKNDVRAQLKRRARLALLTLADGTSVPCVPVQQFHQPRLMDFVGARGEVAK